MSLLSYWIFGTIVSLCCLTIHGREECESGKYGDGCSRNCSQGCKAFRNNEVRCHKETGKCFEGCNAGVYGDRCDQQCSRNCKEHTCIQQNGHCVLGCIENHIGDFCETYQQTTVVHQGTTYSSHTTVTTGVAPTSSSQVVIPVVVTVLVLILILVGAVIFFIWGRKKEKKKRALDTNVEKRSSPGERVSPRQPRSPGHEPTKLHRNRKVNQMIYNKGMADDQESMEEDHENDSEDENTGSDSDEDSGQQVKGIEDFVRDPREQDVTVHVKVMKVGQVEEKSKKKQFMATVADATSAVRICVREEKLFDKFKPEVCIILRNVTWNGKVLFT
ncbi:uncharacterized protein LOC124271120 isoform X2 [Haliotis rubra]|uniref:uncharacterized protein LOC124271120 isoform X2 n=1 Tax=Haliotis rubra TaxID=36100 RepID=UPI001EE5192F|nr:uncharacterized protein LOC124271120 isoform X2 [Haliotis rubra]